MDSAQLISQMHSQDSEFQDSPPDPALDSPAPQQLPPLPPLPPKNNNQCLLPDFSMRLQPKEKVTAQSLNTRLRPLLSKHVTLMEKKKKDRVQQQKQKAVRGMSSEEKVKPPNKYEHVRPRFQESQKERGKSMLPIINPASNIPELEESKVMDDYKIISHVGKGCFSVVSSAINKNTNHKFAIKTYTRIDQMQEYRIKSIQAEVQNLFDLEHENIISLRHAVRDGRKIQLIMENGGKQSLSGLLRKKEHFEELEAKRYFVQVARALAYCHDKRICHRDLKLENMLVDDAGKVKLIDFGFSARCSSQAKLSTVCGTPPYMSPELAAGQPYSGMSADIWALGVALYLMLCGKFPFKAGNEKELYRLIQQGKYKVGATMSSEAKSLLEGMLRKEENARWTAQDILQSEWVKTQ